jgi:hypothetical protein
MGPGYDGPPLHGAHHPSHPLYASGVIAELIAEYDRAKVKHGEHTLDGSLSNDLLRLAALVEEVGEVARWLTYDHTDEMASANRRRKMREELVQVATVATTWASILLSSRRNAAVI